MVLTLHGDVNQITYLFQCTNRNFTFHTKCFIIHPRFEFKGFYFGRDVVQKIGDYAIKERFKPEHIASVLNTEYNLNISESTIRRIIAMVTFVKVHTIDERTLELIKNQGKILLGLDGEDPLMDGPALWCFIVLLSNRVLHTVYMESAAAAKLQIELKNIIAKYQVEIVGVVIDKQSNIVACMLDYFTEIPHQFCTFHFAQNL